MAEKEQNMISKIYGATRTGITYAKWEYQKEKKERKNQEKYLKQK